jgi:hypothetical protein
MRLFEGDVAVGTPVRLGGLTVFPLTGTRVAAPPYLTGPEAFEAGLIRVDELDPPEVPSLAVTNLADVPILLVEGEMLVGGDQNRTMNVTVLIPPHETIVVPVSCVEAGRWGSRRTVSGSTSHAPGSLRAAKTAYLEPRGTDGSRRRSDQHRVWDEVELQSLAHNVQSETSALDDVQLHMEQQVTDQLDKLTAMPGQIGVLCAVGDRVVGLDLFDKPTTLERYLRGIVTGHVLDADANSPATDPVDTVQRFLTEVDGSGRDTGSGVGLGEEVLLRGDVIGIGLAYDECLVHLAAYPRPIDTGS